MKIGENIKKLRELKNYTQAYMATQLDMSISGYAKIESNRTDVSLSKVSKIAEILETDIAKILNFDAKTIFNQSNNTNCLITGNNQTLNINGSLDQFLLDLRNEINDLKGRRV
jgi:transcriptional regulator with XRE-family HTH domain